MFASFYSKQKGHLEDMCLLNFKLKSSILLAALTSASLHAQDYQVEDMPLEPTQADVIQEDVAEAVTEEVTAAETSVAPSDEMVEETSEIASEDVSEHVTDDMPESAPEEDVIADAPITEPSSIVDNRDPNCPTDFYTLPLYPNAKYCQLFAKELPASMSYFAVSDQQSAKDFYLKQLGQAEDEKMLKGRIVLQYSSGEKVVVISKDGEGSQIDILVKSAG